MATSIQVIIAISLVIIALSFAVRTVLSIILFSKFQHLQVYLSTTVREKLELTLGHLQNISARFESLSEDTGRKIEDFSELIPETKEKLEELIDLLDLFQSRIRGPLLNVAAIIKVIGEKFSRLT